MTLWMLEAGDSPWWFSFIRILCQTWPVFIPVMWHHIQRFKNKSSCCWNAEAVMIISMPNTPPSQQPTQKIHSRLSLLCWHSGWQRLLCNASGQEGTLKHAYVLDTTPLGSSPHEGLTFASQNICRSPAPSPSPIVPLHPRTDCSSR